MWLGASEGSFGAGRVLGAVEERDLQALVGCWLVLGLSLPRGGGSLRWEVIVCARVHCCRKSLAGFFNNCTNAQIQSSDGSFSSHPKCVASGHFVVWLKATWRDLRAVLLLFQYRCVGERRQQLQQRPVSRSLLSTDGILISLGTSPVCRLMKWIWISEYAPLGRGFAARQVHWGCVCMWGYLPSGNGGWLRSTWADS